ncbi:carbohydrate ABC transporter permease [Anthocerotibacter panamensis]|uniref:carbohydrate ABC transporter permease n=1 Tax=Anthocerotibacter panamensis TaxID=2857077 RepID=UPI001C401F16|nr:carbohydrate ABC transporter permease [Anthocerotibacter panamensis]
MPKRSPAATALYYTLLAGVGLLLISPLFWLVSTAFKSPGENIFQYPPQLFPQQATWANFLLVWNNYPFARYLWNSTVVSVLAVVCNLFLCALAAYPLARLSFPGKRVIFWLVIGTLMIPFQITMIPLYILAVKLHLTNSYLGLVFPYLVSAFGVFLLRQAFMTVPKELEEAARLDGCGLLQTWWFVLVPAIRPALTTLAVFTFVGLWGDFLWPLIMVDNPDYFTLPLGVATLASAFSEDWRLIAAASVISILPILVFFALSQRFFLPTGSGEGLKG